jgi:hypothetical protein
LPLQEEEGEHEAAGQVGAAAHAPLSAAQGAAAEENEDDEGEEDEDEDVVKENAPGAPVAATEAPALPAPAAAPKKVITGIFRQRHWLW